MATVLSHEPDALCLWPSLASFAHFPILRDMYIISSIRFLFIAPTHAPHILPSHCTVWNPHSTDHHCPGSSSFWRKRLPSGSPFFQTLRSVGLRSTVASVLVLPSGQAIHAPAITSPSCIPTPLNLPHLPQAGSLHLSH